MARRHQQKNPQQLSSESDAAPEVIDAENQAILDWFGQYGKELDNKHDRYERIVKISRDITIESKRIIFLLHNVDKSSPKRDALLAEADARLRTLIDTKFVAIARELQHLDAHQYIRAYTAGLQEFIEALTYLNYVRDDTITTCPQLQLRLTYPTAADPGPDGVDERSRADAMMLCMVDPTEFLLGIGDLGGEVMRRSINAMGVGDFETCFVACSFLRNLYSGFIGMPAVRGKALNNKVATLRQSVRKVEMVCYNIKVRGREEAMRTNIGNSDAPLDADEGYANN